MDAGFWHAKWAKNEIGFHGSEAHPMLVGYFNELAVPPGGRVFLPLCGKTLDIHWLLAKGYRVAGAELSPLATERLFSELGVVAQVTSLGAFRRYSGPDIDIWVGDFFDLSAELLGPVDAVYDRAALVALPAAMRTRYAAHLMAVTGQAPQLLVSFDYDQTLHEGPPFAVPATEVAQHYEAAFKVTRLASVALPGGLKGKCAAQEEVWLLTRP